MTAQTPPDYPYLEVFASDDGYDVWRVTREESSYLSTHATLEELAAALAKARVPVIADSEKLAAALRQQQIPARYMVV
jgi:hypothetical protein